MDLSSQPALMQSRPERIRRGIAMPAVLFALIVIGILGAMIFLITDLHARTVANRERAMRAMHLAESGAAHAVGILRNAIPDTALSRLLLGPNKTKGNSDDGLLWGWNMLPGVGIPAAGVTTAAGTYVVRIMDDPADPTPDVFDDGNARVSVVCTGTTVDGATTTAEIIMGVAQFPAIGVEGELTISGAPIISGECGSAHSNQSVVVTGSPKIEDDITSSGLVTGGDKIKTLGGLPNPPLENQPPLEIPDLKAQDYCASAQFVLKANGVIVKKGPPDVEFDGTIGAFGWKQSSISPVVWETDGKAITPGTICVEGSLKISSSPGKPATPLALSILAMGSVEISGNPHIVSSHPDGIGIIANGDVSIEGNPSAAANNYNGLIYAGSQCEVSGKPNVGGQLLCKNKPNPAGSVNYADQNKISGDAKIKFNCGGFLGGKRRILYWFQQLNK